MEGVMILSLLLLGAVSSDKVTNKLHFVEQFNKDWRDRWHVVKTDKFTGRCEVRKRNEEMIPGDTGLVLLDETAHHATAANFKPIIGADTLVVQYEVQFQERLYCGGAYVKVFDADKSKFSDDTGYIIMFGPDKCGETDRVHFILRFKNPISGAWKEHHCTDPPKIKSDKKTHLYTLHVHRTTFDILIDGKVVKHGSLLTDMTPPINPSKIIDDETDVKPADWVDKKKIVDVNAKKPPKEEWDESEPQFIPDPEMSLPEGWLEHEPLHLPNLDAKIPPEWNEDEEGVWEPPMHENPACVVGCGPWDPPQISNPKYKGKWVPPMIDNPAYKGEWKPRQIENPHFFSVDSPGVLPQVSAIGFELWVIENEILFDNVIVDTNTSTALEFAQDTFFRRKALEDAKWPEPYAWVPDFMKEYVDAVQGWFWSNVDTLMFGIVFVAPFIVLGLFVRAMRNMKIERKPWHVKQDADDEADLLVDTTNGTPVKRENPRRRVQKKND